MDYIHQIFEKKPLIHCITNIVTANECANALLAIGASPTMAHHPDEMDELQRACDALVCNLGATENYDAMLIAAKCATKLNHPIVIDPVGCGGSSYRRDLINELIKVCKPACIRGNYAEIAALANNCSTVTGVDSGDFFKTAQRDIEISAMKLAKDTDAIVVASGAVDIICFSDSQWGIQTIEVSGGDILMSRITGVGCMESALLGAFLSVEKSAAAVKACCEIMKQVGKEAAFETRFEKRGTMTFRQKLIDKLFTLNNIS